MPPKTMIALYGVLYFGVERAQRGSGTWRYWPIE